jgi:DNA-binding Xre family transcriptional regulator
MLSIEIQKLMLERGINKKSLAEHCGWSQSNLYSKLKRDNFTEEELQKICDALDCDLEIKITPKK